MMGTQRTNVALLALLALSLAACTSSHNRGDDAGGPGEACGPTTCPVGEVCCNASCGFCMRPGAGSCPDLWCEGPDAGVRHCGESSCATWETCCSGCPGMADFCVSGSACPAFDCPPPDPGCEACGMGERCCPGCPGYEWFCAAGPVCPDFACAPPECDDARACPDGFYCDRLDGCGGPGMCAPRVTGCTADCPGVCGCDGRTYCNVCSAAAEGVDATDGRCEETPCAGRSYCDCGAGCEPLVDLTPGCICPCDEPFNCSGEDCMCACGGADYLGCAPVDACPETQVRCEAPGCSAMLGPDGCPVCVCDDE